MTKYLKMSGFTFFFKFSSTFDTALETIRGPTRKLLHTDSDKQTRIPTEAEKLK